MNYLRSAIALVVLLGLSLLVACEVKKHPTDLTVRVAVPMEGRAAVVGVLDRATSERGWARTPAAPGLNELAKREVLYFSYGRNPKEMLVTITDLKNPSELEVHAFFEATEPGLVEGVVAKFVAEVRTIPSVSSVQEERHVGP
jgi:hypothetical protein